MEISEVARAGGNEFHQHRRRSDSFHATTQHAACQNHSQCQGDCERFRRAAKFGLKYRDNDNSEKTPLCIHRAPLGTHERFIGFLIEHYAGNFPLWLAPEQIPRSNRFQI